MSPVKPTVRNQLVRSKKVVIQACHNLNQLDMSCWCCYDLSQTTRKQIEFRNKSAQKINSSTEWFKHKLLMMAAGPGGRNNTLIDVSPTCTQVTRKTIS